MKIIIALLNEGSYDTDALSLFAGNLCINFLPTRCSCIFPIKAIINPCFINPHDFCRIYFLKLLFKFGSLLFIALFIKRGLFFRVIFKRLSHFPTFWNFNTSTSAICLSVWSGFCATYSLSFFSSTVRG